MNTTWTIIGNGEYIPIWNIKNPVNCGDPYIIDIVGLQDYWNNSLKLISNNNRPFLVWGPHPSMDPITGYKIYRKVTAYGGQPGNPITFSLLATVGANTFLYIDQDYTIGGNYNTVHYFVKAYNSSTSSSASNIVSTSANPDKAVSERKENTELTFNLSSNYPNPFNPTTKIEYQIPQAGQVSIKVYNSLGSEVATLVNERLDVGKYSVEFDGSNLTSGIYFCVFKSGNHISTNKMLLVK